MHMLDQIYIKYGIKFQYTWWEKNIIAKFMEEKQNQIIR